MHRFRLAEQRRARSADVTDAGRSVTAGQSVLMLAAASRSPTVVVYRPAAFMETRLINYTLHVLPSNGEEGRCQLACAGGEQFSFQEISGPSDSEMFNGFHMFDFLGGTEQIFNLNQVHFTNFTLERNSSCSL